jgi:hypothetical protein
MSCKSGRTPSSAPGSLTRHRLPSLFSEASCFAGIRVQVGIGFRVAKTPEFLFHEKVEMRFITQRLTV